MSLTLITYSFSSTSETAASLQNKPIIYPDTIFKLTSRYHENQKQSNFLKSFHQRIIDERREILKMNNNNKSETCDSSDLGYSIFIDHILNNEGMFSDEDIQDHVITVLSAGNLMFQCHGEDSLADSSLQLISIALAHV